MWKKRCKKLDTFSKNVPKQIEGYQNANWILMDYLDIVVHVFDSENRLFYDLERVWRDGQHISLEDLGT